jgi:hypothetical protein
MHGFSIRVNQQTMFTKFYVFFNPLTGGKRAFGRSSQLPLVAVAQPRPN